MKVNVVKRKAGSNRELSHVSYDIADSKNVRELLYAVMVQELAGKSEVSSPGKIVCETYGKKRYSPEHAWEILQQDFSDGLFRVFFNGREYTALDKKLDLQAENELVIIRLVMMAGRMW